MFGWVFKSKQNLDNWRNKNKKIKRYWIKRNRLRIREVLGSEKDGAWKVLGVGEWEGTYLSRLSVEREGSTVDPEAAESLAACSEDTAVDWGQRKGLGPIFTLAFLPHSVPSFSLLLLFKFWVFLPAGKKIAAEVLAPVHPRFNFKAWAVSAYFCCSVGLEVTGREHRGYPAKLCRKERKIRDNAEPVVECGGAGRFQKEKLIWEKHNKL